MTDAEIRFEAALLADRMAQLDWQMQIVRRPDGQQVATFSRDGIIKRAHAADVSTAILRAITAEGVSV